MIFLLTNDDGYNSPKLQYTREVLEKYGTVYTIAPSKEQSAKSMSLTIGGFNFEKVDEFNYKIEGTPVDCVNFAFGGLNLRPDITISGTNAGYNIGIDTRYSGTVGACLQAQYFGSNTIALSADRRGNTILEKELEKTLQYVLENNLYSKEYTLNINFPRDTFGESKGIYLTDLDYFKFTYSPEVVGNKFKPNRSFIENKELKEGTDTWAYIEGYTSISRIKV
ncbi:5'-nucleotidase SurE [Candidatus Izimaplasma bacterium HR1]|jgi:5'-nucleotidase|uniref:5'/3'-nucleotidase SurE n=1 Tax=Candidatus Izimoplasma sp. HR1 TaxID=1541959 RepID=UPI0004F74959|nr:5'-nucleotidase SurE [Candidatus Izimaplasma bacterium HR1]